MWCQSRNRRPSATSCVQCPTSYAFHQPHPATHRTASYSENPSRLGLRKTFLNCLNDSPAKVFLSFCRQRASILVSHARTLPHYFVNVTYIMLRLVIAVNLQTQPFLFIVEVYVDLIERKRLFSPSTLQCHEQWC